MCFYISLLFLMMFNSLIVVAFDDSLKPKMDKKGSWNDTSHDRHKRTPYSPFQTGIAVSIPHQNRLILFKNYANR